MLRPATAWWLGAICVTGVLICGVALLVFALYVFGGLLIVLGLLALWALRPIRRAALRSGHSGR